MGTSGAAVARVSAAMAASQARSPRATYRSYGQAWIRRAWRRRRAAAQPNNVAIRISPARTLRASSAGREVAGGRRRLTRGSAAEGSRRIAAAVSLTASIRSGLTGPDLMATRRRLVSEGKCRGPRLSRSGSDRGTDRGNHQQQGRDDAEGRKPPMGDFNPAKQRRDTDQAGGEQENGRCSKQPGGNRIGGDGIGRLTRAIAQIGPGCQLDPVDFQRQPGAQPVVRWREHACCSSMTAPMRCHG